MDDIRPRCGWCNLSNPVYVAYHDAEWAVPSHDDHHLFEMLVLETFQAGLSWETILNKRERFRQAFDGFDIERIRRYDENKIAEFMNDPGIIRNRRKIEAIIHNAKIIQSLRHEAGGFAAWLDAHHPQAKESWVKLFKKTFVFTGGEIVGEFDPKTTTVQELGLYMAGARKQGKENN